MPSKNRKPGKMVLNIIPFLPVTLTIGNIVCGVAAILKASHVGADNAGANATIFLQHACWLVFFGMIFDVLDGKVARSVNGESVFGRELDSLADMVSFGVAPAFISSRFLLYFVGITLKDLSFENRMLLSGIFITFVICAALRLARYNVETDGSAHSLITGLPTPGASALVIGNILFFLKYFHLDPNSVSAVSYEFIIFSIFPFILLGSALLMVSRVRFLHMGNFITDKMHSFSFLVQVIFFILIVIWKPVEVFFISVWFYVLWGIGHEIISYLRKRKGRKDTGGSKDDSGKE